VELSVENGKRILIIEDDPQAGEYIAAVLRHSGNTVVRCKDAESALALFAEKPFHVVICDYYMPGMNGAAATKTLKAEFPRTWVIGYSARMVKKKFIEAGADYFLLKPCPAQDLLEIVQIAVER
jgi:two-component system OmpR family response regulator